MERNLLIRFASDPIDDTPQLAATLEMSSIADLLDLQQVTLPGTHVRPLQQVHERERERCKGGGMAAIGDWGGCIAAG